MVLHARIWQFISRPPYRNRKHGVMGTKRQPCICCDCSIGRSDNKQGNVFTSCVLLTIFSYQRPVGRVRSLLLFVFTSVLFVRGVRELDHFANPVEFAILTCKFHLKVHLNKSKHEEKYLQQGAHTSFKL